MLGSEKEDGDMGEGEVIGIGAPRASKVPGWCLHRYLLCYDFLKCSYVLSILWSILQ